MKKLILIAFYTALIGGCSSPRISPATFNPGEEFQLALGQSANIAEASFQLTFITFAEDSRCPVGVVCVWEGNARVVVLVSNVEASLNTSLEPRQISHSGYSVQLLAVNPIPKVGEQFEPEDYIITLVVMKE